MPQALSLPVCFLGFTQRFQAHFASCISPAYSTLGFLGMFLLRHFHSLNVNLFY
jgi:hypothetical protein